MSDDADSGKWLKVKARMPTNRKVLALSDAAFRLHFSVACWCADETTDGFFDADVAAGMPKAPQGKKLEAATAELVRAGLWLQPEKGGYEINDFLKYNMSRAQWEAKKEAGRLGGQRSGESRRGRSEAPPEAPASAPAQPRPQARPKEPPEHDYDYDQRSNKKAAAQDLKRSAPDEPGEAAAAQDLVSDLGEFGAALAKAWHPFQLTSPKHELFRQVKLARRSGVSEQQLARVAVFLGEWLKGRAPDGKQRTLAMVSEKSFGWAVEQAAAEAVAANERQRLLADNTPRKTGPEPAGMTFTEFMKGAASG